MMIRTYTDAASGTLYRTETLDLETGEWTIDEGGEVSTVPADPALVADLRSADREAAQLARLDAKFAEVKANTVLQDSTRLTKSEYGPTSKTDLRDMAQMVNDLRALVIDQRAMILDLTRIVRGMAAE